MDLDSCLFIYCMSCLVGVRRLLNFWRESVPNSTSILIFFFITISLSFSYFLDFVCMLVFFCCIWIILWFRCFSWAGLGFLCPVPSSHLLFLAFVGTISHLFVGCWHSEWVDWKPSEYADICVWNSIQIFFSLLCSTENAHIEIVSNAPFDYHLW